ncbi:Hypothetical protein FKW44_022278, partial [Caligus rogercresseyi]
FRAPNFKPETLDRKYKWCKRSSGPLASSKRTLGSTYLPISNSIDSIPVMEKFEVTQSITGLPVFWDEKTAVIPKRAAWSKPEGGNENFANLSL